MNIKKILLEELLNIKLKHPKFQTESNIYRNPTIKELDKVFIDLDTNRRLSYARFVIVDDTKDVYVFNFDFTHHDFFVKTGIIGDRMLKGILNNDLSIYNIAIEDLLKHKNKGDIRKLKKLLLIDWSWANKYIKVNNYLDKIRKRINKNK